MAALAADGIPALARRHPWLAASLAAHACLAAALYAVGPWQIAQRERKAVAVQVDASMRQAAQRGMRRELRRMEEIRDALDDSAGLPTRAGNADQPDTADIADKPGAAADPVRRAREIAQQIEETRQQIRATEMARVLRIPEEEARRRVRAEAAGDPAAGEPAAHRPAPSAARESTPEQTVQALSKQARDALEERRKQLQAQRDGVPLRPDNARPQPDDRIDALAKNLGTGLPDAITGQSLDMSTVGFRNPGAAPLHVAPPYVDAARLRPGRGSVIGSGGPAANRIFLDTWWIIGPFEGHGGDSQSFVYPPERGVDLDDVYFGKNGQPVHWTWQQQTAYPMVPRDFAENAVYYAYTEVNVDRDMDLWVWIGADDDSKMWFNDSAVWISVQTGNKSWYHQAYTSLDAELSTMNLTEGRRRLHFHKGRNTILFKLYNNLSLMFFSVVLSAQ